MTALALAPAMPTAADEEERLLVRARDGDQDAFNELAGRYSTRLRRTIYRITGDCDAACDAVQEALVRAWQSIDRFEGRSRFYTWLTRIGINEAYRTMRRGEAAITMPLDDGSVSGSPTGAASRCGVRVARVPCVGRIGPR